MSASVPSGLNRREFLQTGTAAAIAVGAGTFSFAQEKKNDPYRGFQMGIQSYTLRDFKVKEALAISEKLGLKYWETFPAHIPVNSVPKFIAEQKEMLAASG